MASSSWRSSTRSGSPKSRQMTLQAAERISDLQFTETYRVPFQYSRLVREHLGAGAFMQSSAGVTVTDLDGNVFYDLTGSYGVNIFGNDFYKECIAKRRGARPRARPGARVLPSRHCRQRRAAVRDFGARRGLVPHVRHRSGDAGGAGSRAITPAARIWCVSPAPITAGGATCSPASAIRFRRTKPIPWPTCRSGRSTC